MMKAYSTLVRIIIKVVQNSTFGIKPVSVIPFFLSKKLDNIFQFDL